MKVDLYDLTSSDDPYPVYRELRDTYPVLRDEEQDFWVVSRYQEVRAVLLDPGTYSSAQDDLSIRFLFFHNIHHEDLELALRSTLDLWYSITDCSSDSSFLFL